MPVWDAFHIDDWPGLRHASYAVAEHRSHHHASSVLRTHPEVLYDIQKAVEMISTIDCIPRSRDLPFGVNPKRFNEEIRESLQTLKGWSFEAAVKDGVVLDQEEFYGKVEGFDIAKYDVAHNVSKLWSVCFGRRSLADGKEYWQKHLDSRPQWRIAADEHGMEDWPTGQDRIIPPTSPTVFGEVQLGNWGLVYRDFFKLLAANAQGEVDLFVYVVPYGDLSTLISSGTVSYDKTNEFVDTFATLINVPTLVVGVDVKHVGEKVA